MHMNKFKHHRRVFAGLSLVLGVAFILPVADARMYQWEQPLSGRIQLSGDAPAWYRSMNPGPRILVFDNGKLIDDTAVAVSELQRQWLREQALGTEAAEEAKRSRPVPLEQTSLQSALTEAAKAGVDIEQMASQAQREAEQENTILEGGLEEKVNELKALLSRWDAARTNEAHAVVNGEENQSAAP